MARKFTRDRMLAGADLHRRHRRSVGESQSHVLIFSFCFVRTNSYTCTTAILCYAQPDSGLTRTATHIPYIDVMFLPLQRSLCTSTLL